jgi:integrase/recombinase XerD
MKLTPADILDPEEIQRMIQSAGNPQDRFLVSVMFEGYLRPIEIMDLTWNDILIKDSYIVVSAAVESCRPRKVWCMNSKSLCLDWKNQYPFDPNGENHVFVSSNGKPLTSAILSVRIKRIVKRAGIQKKVSPFLFRHSGIVELLRQGVPLRLVKLQGWGDVNTNLFDVSYCHLNDSGDAL